MNNVSIIQKLIKINSEQGLLTYIIGRIKNIRYAIIKDKLDIDAWHTPYELRPYAYVSVREINKIEKELDISCACEVGCGLGDIIRNIHAGRKVGLDISETAISGARKLGGNVEWSVGSFQEVSKYCEGNLDLLISVNFIHMIDPVILRKEYEALINSVNVRFILLDIVDGAGYAHCHNLDTLLPEYELYKVLGQWGERRMILVKKR